MNTLKSIMFYLGVGMLLTHEMDAMPNREWRVLPILRSFSDSVGELTFLLAHVPIFAFLIAFVASLHLRVRNRARNLVCAFLVIHAGLHYAFAGHSNYEFAALRSQALIYGAALFGLVYFVAAYLEPRLNQQRVA